MSIIVIVFCLSTEPIVASKGRLQGDLFCVFFVRFKLVCHVYRIGLLKVRFFVELCSGRLDSVSSRSVIVIVSIVYSNT